jgi:hypothetical protein
MFVDEIKSGNLHSPSFSGIVKEESFPRKEGKIAAGEKGIPEEETGAEQEA